MAHNVSEPREGQRAIWPKFGQKAELKLAVFIGLAIIRIIIQTSQPSSHNNEGSYSLYLTNCLFILYWNVFV